MCGGPERRCVGSVYGLDGARQHQVGISHYLKNLAVIWAPTAHRFRITGA